MDEEERTGRTFWTDQVQACLVEFKVCEKRQIKHIINYKYKANSTAMNKLSIASVLLGDEHDGRSECDGGELSLSQ